MLKKLIRYVYRIRVSFPIFIINVFRKPSSRLIIERHAAASNSHKPPDSVHHSALRFTTIYSTTHRVLCEKVGRRTSSAVRRDRHWFLFIHKALIGNSLIMYRHYTGPTVIIQDSPLRLNLPCTHVIKTAFSLSDAHTCNTWNALAQCKLYSAGECECFRLLCRLLCLNSIILLSVCIVLSASLQMKWRQRPSMIRED